MNFLLRGVIDTVESKILPQISNFLNLNFYFQNDTTEFDSKVSGIRVWLFSVSAAEELDSKVSMSPRKKNEFLNDFKTTKKYH